MKTASVSHQQVTALDNEIAYQSRKQFTTSTLDVVVNNQRVMGLDSETAHQLKTQLRLTAAAPDAFVDSIPLTRLPQLTQTVAGGHFTLPKGLSFIQTNRSRLWTK